MAGLKIGWDQSSLQSLRTQLMDQIDRLTQQEVKLDVNINNDKAINQLKELVKSLDDIAKSNNPSVDLQLNTVKAKEDLAKITGSFYIAP